MRRIMAWGLASFVLGFGSLVGGQAAYATWAQDYCTTAVQNTVDPVNRSTARSYALSADGDGYEWGGGCWDQDGVDDTPNQPDSGGEGADCSGFVFKTWKMTNSYGATGWKGWSAREKIHGPYTAADIKGDPGAVMVDRGKAYSDTLSMDAFANSTHTGMIYAEKSSGYDDIIEAKGDAVGTGVFQRSYRSDSSYDAAARVGWATGCTGCE